MRLLTALLCLWLVAATGYCTGHYVETGENHQPGLIQEGDVFEYWCELPAPAAEEQELTVQLTYPNGELLQALFTPRIILPAEVALYP